MSTFSWTPGISQSPLFFSSHIFLSSFFHFPVFNWFSLNFGFFLVFQFFFDFCGFWDFQKFPTFSSSWISIFFIFLSSPVGAQGHSHFKHLHYFQFSFFWPPIILPTLTVSLFLLISIIFLSSLSSILFKLYDMLSVAPFLHPTHQCWWRMMADCVNKVGPNSIIFGSESKCEITGHNYWPFFLKCHLSVYFSTVPKGKYFENSMYRDIDF